MNRPARICVEVCVAVLGIVLVLGGVAVWRLASGPVPVGFLTPYLEQAFNERQDGETIEIGETVLTWENWSRNFDLRARQTKLRDADGRLLASLPDVAVSLNLRALVRGTVAPTTIEIMRPRLALTRGPDGEIEFGQANGPTGEGVAGEGLADGVDAGDIAQTLPLLVEQLLEPADPEAPLAYLSVVRLVDGSLTIRDDALGLRWLAEAVTIELRSDDAGLAGEAVLSLSSGEQPADVQLGFIYDPDDGVVDLAASFGALQPRLLAALSPVPELLSGLELDLEGTATATLSLDGRIDALDLQVGGGPGRIAVGDFLPEPRPLRAFDLRAGYDAAADQVTLETATLRFGDDGAPGPTLSLEGRIAEPFGDMAIAGELRVTDLPTGQLDAYWPRGVSDNGRAWVVENIRGGVAEEATVALAARVPGGDFQALEFETFGGTLRFSGLDVHYLRPMPPVTGVAGTAVFGLDGMAFEIAGGRLGELRAGETKVVMTGFRADTQDIEIDVPVSGPLRDVLQLLNHERLRLVERVGIEPQATSGLAATRTSFRFPLIAALALDDLEIASRANLAEVAIDDLILGQNARDGTLSLELDKSSMTIAGALELGTVPIDLKWVESSSDSVPDRSRIEALAPRFTEAQRKAFGFDVWPDFSGPVSASVLARIRRDGTSVVSSAVNIQDARLAAPFLLWEKPPGVAGEAHLSLLLAGDRLVALQSLAIEAGDLSLTASGRFAPDGESLAEITLDSLAFGGTAVRGVRVVPNGPDATAYDVQIAGGVIDVEPFIDEKGKADEAAQAADEAPGEIPGEASGERGEAARPETGGEETAFRLRAPALERLRFGEGRSFEAVSLDLQRDGAGWQRLTLQGDLPPSLWTGPARSAVARAQPGGPEAQGPRARLPEDPADEQESADTAARRVSIDYGPAEPGFHELEIVADDLGGFLRALDILDTVRGGTLTITGREPAGAPMRARVEAKDFTLGEAPALARLLLVASLTGLVEGLRGDGIAFQRLVGEVDVRDGIATSRLVRAYGTSIGITAKGRLDANKGMIDISGTIVPAYILNRILGEIPLLGPLLTGGEGEGFVAFDYTMNGDLDDPEVSVNALSALAPGFLRNLIGGDLGDGSPIDLPQGTDR